MQSRMDFLPTQKSQLRWPMPLLQWGLAKICALNMSESRELYNSWSTEVRRYGRGNKNGHMGSMVLSFGIDFTVIGVEHHGAL